MSDKKVVKPIALAVGAALAGSFALTGVAATNDTVDSPFGMTELSAGYMLGAGEGSCGGDKEGKGDTEGSCGEGSCGGDKEGKGDSEGSCGEGSCGESGDKEGEGACGEGSCGEDMEKEAEGACGEGSCGGSI